MNRKISTPAGLMIILVFAVIFLSVFINAYSRYKDDAARLTSNTGKHQCTLKTYAGEANVKGWYIDNSQKLLRLSKADIAKLPNNKIDRIKIIDITPDVEKKLKNSSEKKPAEITITGIALPCDGVALASINYKDHIFRPYLDITN